MARLQILELPTEHHGDDMVTPFVLVVDGWDVGSLDEYTMLSDYWDQFAAKIGARGVLFTNQAVEIPANETATQADPPSDIVDFADLAEAKRLMEERDEARSWARHGYEIGQKHCGWTDHGVAPDWLTEGWPRHFESCEHLQKMAEFDEALTRVRALAERWRYTGDRKGSPLSELRAALDGADRATPGAP